MKCDEDGEVFDPGPWIDAGDYCRDYIEDRSDEAETQVGSGKRRRASDSDVGMDIPVWNKL